MRSATKEAMVLLAQKAGAIGELVKANISLEKFDPAAAGKAIEDAGYEVDARTVDRVHWFRASLNGELKMQGASQLSAEDAFLHAVFGAVREENARLVVEHELTGVATFARDITPQMRQQLETTYITKGLTYLRAVLGKK